MDASTQILDHMSALSEALRSRLLLLLERQELTVTQLCAVLQLPQSTVSRHLKTLGEGGWLDSRRDGTRRLYHMRSGGLEASALQLWRLTRGQIRGTPPAAQDARRLASVLAEQRNRSQEFFRASAETWDRLRAEMFGAGSCLQALLGLLGENWTVADLGCGTGLVSEALAPVVERVIAVDGSDAMLRAAGRRLAEFDNVDLRRGELEDLPIPDGEVDAATLMLVLHHLPDPGKAIAEVGRVLRPGGRLLIVDMLPHDREEYRQEMGHAWLGFSEQDITRYLEPVGLSGSRFHALRPDPRAKGPDLFAITALRNTRSIPKTRNTKESTE